jgi:ABC-type multidrug transport system fused ATPase/permease subunit
MQSINNFIYLFKLFSFRKKISFLVLVLLLILCSILDAVGIVLLVPFFDLVLQNESSKISFFIFNFIKSFINPDLGLGFILLFLAFFILKSLVVAFTNYLHFLFVFKVQSQIKINIFSHYISLPYINFLQIKSSTIINQITQDVHLFSFNFTAPILNLLAESMIVIAVLILLFILQPVGLNFLFFAFVLILVFYLFFKICTKNMNNWGVSREEMDQQALKIFQNTLANIKVTKISNLGRFFLDLYITKVNISSKAQSLFYTFSQYPRIFVELALVILLLSCYYFASIINTEKEIITSLAVLAVSAFRIAPSINRIMLSLAALKYSKSIFKSVKPFLHSSVVLQKKNLEKKKITKNSILKIKKISFYFKKKCILKNISLNIHFGDMIGIIGNSGSGKTTMLDIISGLLKPSSGSIYLDDKKINLNSKSWQQNINYVTQSNILLDENIYKNISYDTKDFDKKKINNILNRLELDLKYKKLGERGMKISGGQAQRVSIARAIYSKPKLLLIDEGTSALDAHTENLVMDYLYSQKNNITLVFVTHRHSVLKKCNKIYEIKNNCLILKKNHFIK